MKKHTIPLAIIFLFGVVGMKALFHEGLFTAHDIWHQVARLYWYSKSLGAAFPPDWVSPLGGGFGYPLFIFSYHFPWIVGFILLKFGLGYATIIKSLFFGSYIFSGIFMYAFLFGVFKKRLASLVGALLYMWAPYRFLTILVSAAMGKAFVLTFTPLLFLGVYLLAKNKSYKTGILVFVTAFLGLSLSHMMSFVSIIPALFLMMLVLKINLKRLSLGLLLAVGLSSFYIIPAVFYSGLTQIKTGSFSYLYKSQFINVSQILYSKWGYGMIVRDAREGAISFQLGIAQWIGIILLVLCTLLFRNKRIDAERKKLAYVIIFVFVAAIVATNRISMPIWEFVSKLVTLDYPTMFMVPLLFVSSMGAAWVISLFRSKTVTLALSFLFIFALVFGNKNHLRVNLYTDIPLQTYIDSEVTTSSFGEYYPSGFDQKLVSTKKDVMAFGENVKSSNVVYTPRSVMFDLYVDSATEASFRHLSFPGVSLYVNGTPINYGTSKEKLVTYVFEKGEYKVKIVYEKTPLMRISQIVSVTSLLFLLVVLAKRNVA